ncbi:MAG TPA: YfhO family protein [Chthoniobacterales bacterium]|nr:YfhO family protein [Chthoniobacterales bacterium]
MKPTASSDPHEFATQPDGNNRFRLLFMLLPAFCLLLLGALIYRGFLFGDAVLLYKDIGSDSINDSYPWFVHFSDYLRSDGLPSWSFYVGMGQDIYFLVGYLLWQPIVWLPRELIAQALVYQHLAKVLLAGLFFFRFLQLRGVKWPVSLLGAHLLAFSAYMCMGSCWFILADEVVGFTALLLATELALDRGKWWLLSVAIALIGMIGAFYLYLCALLLLFYVPARLFGRYGWQPRLLLRGCLVLAGAAVLGVGLGAIVTLPNLYTLLNSPRGAGTTSFAATLASHPIFGFESRLHYITAALKPFANDALGTAEYFTGWNNYLEAPLTYCGLFCLVIFPQIFVKVTRRERILSALFVAGLLVPTIFPWFRYLFWAFQGDYYRTYSLFSLLGLAAFSMIAFSRYLEGRPLNLWFLAITTIVLVATLYLPIEDLQTRLNPDLRLKITILLLAYSMLLAAGQLLKRQQLIAWIVLGLAATELALFDQISVSNRKTVSKAELSQRVGYNDETVDAIRDIKSTDSTFFRLMKLQPSALSAQTSLNDAMVFRYYGTSSYGSFNSVNYTNFLTAVGAMPPDSEADTRWATGLAGNFVLSMFGGEKYTLVSDPVPIQKATQYEFIRAYGKEYLFRNNLFLPLGLTYTHYIPEDLFRRLPRDEREQVLLGVAVLSDTTEAEKQGLKEVTIPDLEKEMAATSFPAIIDKRRKTALHLTSFRQTKIEGSIRLEQKSVLVLQTPFDQGWRALQDGNAAPALKVDVGLLGVILDAGEHVVQLRYRTPFLTHGIALTVASLLVLGVGLWRWPRVPLLE